MKFHYSLFGLFYDDLSNLLYIWQFTISGSLHFKIDPSPSQFKQDG